MPYIVANELTRMCMQVVEDIRLVYPSVGLCYTEGMPEEYLNQACQLLAKGHSHPAIFHDEVDSLYAIKQLVFVEKRITIGALKDVLDNNFTSEETLRLYIQNKIPKYGNDIDEIDQYFNYFTEHIIEECTKYTPMHTNGKLIPSVFCWVMHERFGRETSATPDGRKAGFPLGDGSGPCQGREFNGPTASILSSTKWDHSKLIGGVAVNLKFANSSLGPDSLQTIKTLIQTYLKRGGFELQINVVDSETLKEEILARTSHAI